MIHDSIWIRLRWRMELSYDELSADGVTPRPHWAHLMESLREIGPEELGRPLEPR